jgi:hypothetical protein
LPNEAWQAFEELHGYLCSSSVTDYPHPDRPYYLITDVSLGDDRKPGGLSTILTQTNNHQQQRVIAYASRKLTAKEKNFLLFLIKMEPAVWAMNHFCSYL